MQPRDVSFEALRRLLMETCMLKIPADQIGEETPLFSPEGVGLDSLDALQISVAIEQKYGIPIENPEEARQIFQTLSSIREWLLRQLDTPPAS